MLYKIQFDLWKLVSIYVADWSQKHWTNFDEDHVMIRILLILYRRWYGEQWLRQWSLPAVSHAAAWKKDIMQMTDKRPCYICWRRQCCCSSTIAHQVNTANAYSTAHLLEISHTWKTHQFSAGKAIYRDCICTASIQQSCCLDDWRT